jgi:hypothetical protein
MKLTYLIFTVALSSLIAGTAYADIDDCFVPMSQWQSRNAVQTMAEDKGWKVRRIKTDDGCYEIKGWDEKGIEIEVLVDPATLDIVKYESDHSDHSEDDSADDDNNEEVKAAE